MVTHSLLTDNYLIKLKCHCVHKLSISSWRVYSNAELNFPYSAGWESLDDTSLLGELDLHVLYDSGGSPVGQYAQIDFSKSELAPTLATLHCPWVCVDLLACS